MYYIAHRINTINQLKKLDKKYGIEIDIRDNGKNLVVVHNPFKKGILLKSFLKFYKHKILIANIKSERIEDKVIKVLKKYNISNYFFLDSSFPKIIDLVKKKFKKIALRVSFYESISTAKKLKGKEIHKIQNSYDKIFNNINPIMQNIKNLSKEERAIVEVNEIIEFIEDNIKRGICKT